MSVKITIEGQEIDIRCIGQHVSVSAGTSFDSPSPDERFVAVIQRSNPHLWWRLGETSGTVMTEVLHALNGVYQNTPTLGENGGIVDGTNKAVKFNGTDEYATVADNALLNLGTNYSIEVIFKLNAQGAGRGLVWNGTGGWAVFVDTQVDTKILFGKPFEEGIYGSHGIGLDVQNHVVITVAGLTVTMYFNGVLMTNIPSGSIYPPMPPGFEIARQSTTGYLNATIDEVILYKHVLPANQVRDHEKARVKGGTTVLDVTLEP